MRQQKALMPDKPFFVYFAPGAVGCAFGGTAGGVVAGGALPAFGSR